MSTSFWIDFSACFPLVLVRTDTRLPTTPTSVASEVATSQAATATPATIAGIQVRVFMRDFPPMDC